ncbi:4-hydroxy-tetrahydrodipicolinate synthase [Desulfosporosinus sp. FKB]|uniref:4-hydroxy-tetrahydrodipicolinate synthase n=1 Tax=Desulfosporosinus sp. FKB TaxID=1969835 RepID=UPI000B498174|nr:4-hydroxy-tetrahydrodipicolinate synthase [Desulfosporosinus sp. FKB]
MKVEGVFVPLVTPFKNGKIDYNSFKRMIDYYINKGVSGLIPLATTGEIPTISEYEYEEIIEKTMEYNNNRIPVYVGLGGNNTSKAISQLKLVEKNRVNGILSVCPYYNRPSQRGIFEHFRNISEATSLDIIIYNVPYRTGSNIANDTVYKLAEIENIVAIKDSCGDIRQTSNLLLKPPENISILTGEDVFYYTSLTLGGNGGILASAHLNIEEFLGIFNAIKNNNYQLALAKWKSLFRFIPLLFEEPNPTPIKYCLFKLGIIDSPEVRLPLTEITSHLKESLNRVLL